MTAYPRIIILAVYFGPLPNYFPLWLKSCAANADFDWLVVTDQTTNDLSSPKNVHFESLTLERFSAIMAQTTNLPIKIAHPYKICDFKPLFWALLEGKPHYDFWGHCDLDVIFGKLGDFIKPNLLHDYDKIFSVGHLTIYRNNEYTNNFYRMPHPQLDWRSVLSDPAHRGFDEHIGVNLIWQHHGGRFYQNESLIADLDPHLSRFELSSNYFRFKNYKNQAFYYKNGRIWRVYINDNNIKNDEFMYIHFQKRQLIIKLPHEIPDQFYIAPTGFIPMLTDAPARAELQKLNPAPWIPSLSEITYRTRKRVRDWRNSRA